MISTRGAVLVAYDIPDEKRRRSVAKALERLGRRAQYSVFIVHRGTPDEIAAALAPLLVPGEDDVRIHPLCAACNGRVALLGLAREVEHAGGYRVL